MNMHEICAHVIVGDYYVFIIHDLFLHCLNCLTMVVYLLFLPPSVHSASSLDTFS